MAQYCQIAKQYTNCTDNCKNCMAEEKRYAVMAYLHSNRSGLMDNLETNDFSEAHDFMWEHCQQGNDCELLDRETGIREFYYSNNFDENAVDTADLRKEKHNNV